MVYGTRDSGFDPQQSRYVYNFYFQPSSTKSIFITIQSFITECSFSNRVLQSLKCNISDIQGLCGPMDKALVYGTKDSGFDPQQRLCGPMDKALVYGTRDSGFDLQQSCYVYNFYFQPSCTKSIFITIQKFLTKCSFSKRVIQSLKCNILDIQGHCGPMDKALVYGTRDSWFEP
nr:Uncharacterized protein APZ42_013478 [Ipomoea batatas]